MERSVPIETKLGIITMRDSIFLDHVKSDGFNMTFTVDINGGNVSARPDERDWFPCILNFRNVLACFSCELDTYESMGDVSYHDSSDFDMIEESVWLRSIPIRKDCDIECYHHYRLVTYDVVYNIIAADYELDIKTDLIIETNEKRAQDLVKRLGFDFSAISKSEIRTLIEQEIEDFQEGSSEYIRLLCGYLYCVGDMTDVALLEKAKYGINMDVGCMIDGEWIDSLKNDGQQTESVRVREHIIKCFIDYYQDYEADDDE